jgi:hypothetical protein
MPPMDLGAKTDSDLDQWIANHEGKPGGTALPLYRQLLEERVRRAQTKPGLKPERSLEHLKQAAIRQVCTSYGDLAKASDLEWSKAHRQMNGATGHLDRLLDLCHARGLPLLTAICVNKDNVAAGELPDGWGFSSPTGAPFITSVETSAGSGVANNPERSRHESTHPDRHVPCPACADRRRRQARLAPLPGILRSQHPQSAHTAGLRPRRG